MTARSRIIFMVGAAEAISACGGGGGKRSSALLKLVRVTKDVSSAVYSTTTSITRITLAGAVTFISSTTTNPNGDAVALTYQTAI